jgi:hypothetical protein
LFGADTLVMGESAILAEGEFDAMLLWQEASDLVGVARLGSCNLSVSAKASRYVLGCPRLLVAYDVDAEATRARSSWSNCRRACGASGRRWART